MEVNLGHQINIHVDDHLADRLAQLAFSLNRSEAWLVEQAIRQYAEDQSWQMNAIDEALGSYRAGHAELIPHETVMGRLGARF